MIKIDYTIQYINYLFTKEYLEYLQRINVLFTSPKELMQVLTQKKLTSFSPSPFLLSLYIPPLLSFLRFPPPHHLPPLYLSLKLKY